MNLFELCAVLKLNKDQYERGLGEAESSANSVGSKIGSALSTVAKTTAVAVGTASVAVGKLVQSSVEAYAEYEQLVGGVETLFKDSADKVMEYANNAYMTAGLSANEYMETVTSFSASLLQSLGGDTAKASAQADKAITDMSDNANKMGTSMESIQNAYQGFAKQNYTMLDNLKLGYGGTKEEMERLLEDAEKLSGIEYDISSYSDIVDAIHVVQEEMGITGTTAKEAGETISGSIGMMKASWQNLITGLADGNADISGLVDNFVNAVSTVGKNLMPVIMQALNGIGTLVKTIVPKIVEAIPPILKNLLPAVFETVSTLLVESVPVLLEALSEMLPEIIDSVMEMLIEAVPILIDTILEVVTQLADSLSTMLPTLIPAVTQLLVDVLQKLVDNIPLIIDCALKLVTGLAQGLLNALPILIHALPTIITGLVNGILEGIPMIIDAGVQLLVSLVANLPTIIVEVVKAIPQIITGIVTSIQSFFPKLVESGKNLITKMGNGIKSMASFIFTKAGEIATKVIDAIKGLPDKVKNIGVDLVKGLWNGIKSMGSWMYNKIYGWASDIIDSVAGFFGIASPSRVMRDKIGKYLPMGIAVGMDQYADTVLDSAEAIKSDVLDSFNDMNDQINNQLSGDYSVSVGGEGGASGYSINDVFNVLNEWLPQLANMSLVMDTGATVGQLAPAMDRELGTRLAFAQRGV